MTLAASATKLQEGIKDLGRLERMNREIETYQTRARMLRGPLDQLQPLAIILGEFTTKGIAVRFDVTRSASLKEQAFEFRDAYKQDPESILRRSQTTHYNFYHGIESLPAVLRGCLESAWRSYVDNRVGTEQTQMLDTMARVDKLAPVVATVRKLYAEVGQLKASLPQSDGDFAKVERLAEELRAAKARLEGIPDDVLAFLRSAWSNTGADLAQLTPEVLAWLDSYDMKGHVKVVLR